MYLFEWLKKHKGAQLDFNIEECCDGKMRKAILTDKNIGYRKALHVSKNNPISENRLRLELVKDYCYKQGIQHGF